MENSKEDEERLVDAEDNVRLICNNYFLIIIDENSEESSYSFLVFLWGYINLNTFTEMVKNYAKRFEKLYNSKDFDEANKNLNENKLYNLFSLKEFYSYKIINNFWVYHQCNESTFDSFEVYWLSNWRNSDKNLILKRLGRH